MNRIILAAFTCLLFFISSQAQKGTLQVTFTPQGAGKSMHMQFAIPLLKFNNPHGFWFVNPHNGDRHMQYMPDMYWGDRKLDVAYITINDKNNDFDVYEGTANDSNQLNIRNNNFLIAAPEYHSRDEGKLKPMHVHINNFTATECSFTLSGGARLSDVNGSTWTAGTIEGSAHFYREPGYEKSDILPGCDCDPTIYAKLYDEDNNLRTSSACETAIRNKVFDAVQKAMAPLFTNMAHQGTGQLAPGEIDITMLPGHVNINVAPKERPYCSSDYQHNWLTTITAHKNYFNNEESYGLRFIKMPTAAVLGGGSDDPVYQQKHIELIKKNMLLVSTGKLTAEQYQQAENDFNKQNGVVQVDIKEEEIAHNLTVKVMINSTDAEMMLVKLGDKKNTRVQHTIKGIDYEVFTGQVKENDGEWIPNRMALYAGKFNKPVAGKSGGGWDAEICTPLYPVNGNKLTVYNVIIKLEGDKAMMDKAVANINFDAILSLITKQ